MRMRINGDTFTTYDDLWSASKRTQAKKDEVQLKIDLVGKRIEACGNNYLGAGDAEFFSPEYMAPERFSAAALVPTKPKGAPI